MDFWRTLLGGSSQRKQAAANNPQQRLARFKHKHGQILDTWRKSKTLAEDPDARKTIRIGFQGLTSILNDESRSPAPHLCLNFAAHQQIYTAVSKIAATAKDEGLVRDAIALYGALIDSEEEDFLENDVFAVSLMNLISHCVGGGSNSIAVGEDITADIVELLFGISAKIRLQPEILPVWFTQRKADPSDLAANKKIDFAGVRQEEDFPLCYQLIHHVHHEGRIGDFARTGLLYIFESASKSISLEQWIVNGDLPTYMASGLGALYSQLSRKLSILHPPEELPLILKFSDYAEMQPNTQAESFFSPPFQVCMETFLSYLTFWQDVLEHCRSVDVRQTLIDHFQILFLQQLLYPSLLESSDVDGGSSVAVLTYLRRILDALDHPELIHMILHYLLGLPDNAPSSPIAPRSPAAVKRRESLMLIKEIQKEEDKMNPSLFNLVDLILSSAESHNPQTVVAGLKLTTVILSKNHSYAIGSLIKVLDVYNNEPARTVGALDAELQTYLDLAVEFAGESGVDEAYESQLKDKLSMLENHPCSLETLGLPTSPLQSPNAPSNPSSRNVSPHYLVPEDSLSNSLFNLLLRFLTNDVETNLGLTETIITLASCSQLRLEGLLSVEPSKYQFKDGNELQLENFSTDNFRDMYKAKRKPTWLSSAAPPLLACLQDLQTQVNALRADIQDFDEHVANRKQAFHIHEEISEATKSTPPRMKSARPSAELPPGSWTPQVPRHILESSTTPSRTSSPRGRKEALDLGSTPTSSPAPSRLGGQTLVGSPSRGMSPLPAPTAARTGNRNTTLMADVFSNLSEVANSKVLKRRIRFRKPANARHVEVLLAKHQPPPKEPSDDPMIKQEEEEEQDDVREASLGHVITNVVVLQEFVLEIMAVMQVRASLFSEVRHA